MRTHCKQAKTRYVKWRLSRAELDATLLLGMVRSWVRLIRDGLELAISYCSLACTLCFSVFLSHAGHHTSYPVEGFTGVKIHTAIVASAETNGDEILAVRITSSLAKSSYPE